MYTLQKKRYTWKLVTDPVFARGWHQSQNEKRQPTAWTWKYLDHLRRWVCVPSPHRISHCKYRNLIANKMLQYLLLLLDMNIYLDEDKLKSISCVWKLSTKTVYNVFEKMTPFIINIKHICDVSPVSVWVFNNYQLQSFSKLHRLWTSWKDQREIANQFAICSAQGRSIVM